MLVVVASRLDEGAAALVRRGSEVRVLSCEDLSTPGWRHRPGAPESSTAVVGGEVIPSAEIEGVLVRRARVLGWETSRLAPADRAYAAAEMTAFLRSWLCGLGCPVLNLPSATCLSGPGWCREEWLLAAARLGIPVRTVRRSLDPREDSPQDEPAFMATVVGERCLGAPDREASAWAARLARAANVDLLAVRFGEGDAGPELLDADPWADVSVPEVADAVLEYLDEGRRC